MAWSPPACQRRLWFVEQTGDYATLRFHHIRDATDLHNSIASANASALKVCLDLPSTASAAMRPTWYVAQEFGELAVATRIPEPA
jgi:hypothetical protein